MTVEINKASVRVPGMKKQTISGHNKKKTHRKDIRVV
jgi:hypothetical protein